MALFLLAGGGAVVAGIVLGAFLATSVGRIAVLAVVGTALFFAAAAVWVLSAPRERPEPCSDCGEFFGRWIDPFVFFFPIVNSLAWALGLLVGAVARRMLARQPTGGS